MSESPVPLTQVRCVDVVRAVCDFNPSKKQQLQLKTGDLVYVLSKMESGWWDGVVFDQPSKGSQCQRGWFPHTFTKSLKGKITAHQALSGGLGAGGSANHLYTRPNSALRHPSTPTLRRNSFNSRAPSFPAITTSATSLTRAFSGTPNELHLSPQISRSSSPSSSQNHLKQDYKLDMRHNKPISSSSRKAANSNSSNIIPSSNSTFAEITPVDPLQKLSSYDESSINDTMRPTASNNPSSDKIRVLSVAEVEMFVNSMGNSGEVPVWTPISVEDAEVIFYNKQYNIYCRTLPLLENPEMNCTSVFPRDDHLVNLKMGKLDDAKGGATNSSAPQLNLMSQSGWTNINTPLEESRQVSLHDEEQTSEHSPTRDVNKKESEETDSVWTSQHQVFYSKQKLFFHHHLDIRSWTELRDSTVYYVQLSHESFFRNNHRQFRKNFNQVSKLISMHQIACRLLRSEVMKNDKYKIVRKLLKNMIKSLSRILVTSTLYFNSNHRVILGPRGVIGRYSTTEGVPNFRDLKASISSQKTKDTVNEFRLNPITGGGAASNPTDSSSLPFENLGTMDPIASNVAMGSSIVSSSTDQTVIAAQEDDYNQGLHDTSITKHPSTSTTIQKNSSCRDSIVMDEESGLLIDSMFEIIDTEFGKFKSSLIKLHHIMKRVFAPDDVIPQIYPRLFKNSFDGGAWMSVFNQQLESQDSSVVCLPCASTTGSGSIVASSVTGLDSTGLGVRQFSSTSSRTSGSLLNNKHKNRTFSRSKLVKKIRYPLNNDTLNIFKAKLTQLSDKYDSRDSFFLGLPKSKSRDLELAACTYETIGLLSSMVDIMESIDLTFFINLRNLPAADSATTLDKESMDFRDHCVVNVTTLLMEFFDVKQAAHDIGIGIIMETQHMTLRDPFVFCPMKGDLADDKEEDMKKYQCMKHAKFASALARHLIKQDVECNDMNFLDTDYTTAAIASKLLQIMDIAAHLMEQLVNERENIINYAARLMKNDLISELVKGEQEKWFDEDESNRSVGDMYGGGKLEKDIHSSKKEDLPWYLDNQYDYALIYDNKGNIKGGTKDALIERLTSHLTIDPSFNVTMLITFISIFSTTEFLSALISRYNLYPPEGLGYDEYNIWVEKKHIPIKVRVINILKLLFSQYWTPAYYDGGLEDLLTFAQLVTVDEIPGAEGLVDLINNVIAQKNNFEGFVPKRIPFTADTSGYFESGIPNVSLQALSFPALTTTVSSSSLSTGFRLKKMKLLDIESSVFAKQLTIKENMLYCKIRLFECLDRTWRTRYCDFGGSENISNFIRNSNHLTNYVSYMIVKQTDLKRRIQIIQYFIDVAEHCRNLNNFSSMTAIISAMFSSSIYRLRRTWSMIAENYKEVLESLNTLMDSTRNFSRYRELLESIGDVPCVPFFGVYLSDLTFTAGGNPDFLKGSTEVVNFGKRSRIVSVLKEVDSYQRIGYKLRRLADVQDFLNEQLSNVPNIEKQYEQSLLIEPRTEVSTGLNSTSSHYHGKHGSANAKGKKLRFVDKIKRSNLSFA